METVSFLAQLWGFSLIGVSLALLINSKQMEKLWALAEHDAQLFVWGALLFVAGVASILSYNVWDESWHVVVTLAGWALAVKGGVYMFATDYAKKLHAKMKAKKDGMMFALAAAVVLGCILLYFGFAS